MIEQESINQFAEELLQDTIAGSDSTEDGEFRVDEFTRIYGDYLIEAGEIDDINICYYRSRGMQMNGYDVSQDENCIDIFISIFNQESPPVTVTKAQCEAAFRQAETCVRKGFSGYHTSLEEASEIYDAFQRFHELREQISKCRIYLFTDGIVSQESFEAADSGDLSISLNVWDIRRLFRLISSGKRYEPIEINFEAQFGLSIPCLPLADSYSDYKGYLAVIPGEVLAGMYDAYGPRLLERNVRSFLQARGKINKGIRKTILEEPHRFFAYNNGITATADNIDFITDKNLLRIARIRNLQIVNGGQTTASLYHAFKKDKADITGISVQAKLSVIPEEHVEEIVPLISRYANSQNKVSDADFYANDPFHVELEELSRTVWAPAVGGTNRQTKWFYERARGQYLDAKGREGTPARKRQFEAQYPSRQKFTKTDLAKYENTWRQLPHVVSLGAQKNFNDFSVRLKERGRVCVDKMYFEHLVAKAILFKRADKIIEKEKFGGYKANIVTYTIAWLAHYTSQRIDLDRIWKEQELSPTFQEAIRTVSRAVQRIITSPPDNKNVTEWCKRLKCWERVKGSSIPLDGTLEKELLNAGEPTAHKTNRSLDSPNEQEQVLIKRVSDVSSDRWFEISKWAKETGNLQPWQRGLAYSIGRVIGRSGQVSVKQAIQGVNILEEVQRLGFKV